MDHITANIFGYLKDKDKLWETLSTKIVNFAGNTISIIIILILGVIAIKIGNKVISKFFDKHKTQSKYRLSDRKADTLSTILKSILRYTIYFIMGVSILQLFGVEIGSILAVAGVGGVAIGFGAQNLVKDVITGFFILLEDQFGVGDIVTLNSRTGTVEEIGLRTTRIRSFDGDVHIIPNGEIGIVTNLTRDFKRAIVDIGIAYEENVDHAIQVIQEVLDQAEKDLENIINKPQILGVQSFGDSSVNIRLFVDCKVKENWGIERELRKRIKQRFDEVGIEIPYPKRSLYMATDLKISQND